MASESHLSDAGNLINDYRGSLADDTISSSLVCGRGNKLLVDGCSSTPSRSLFWCGYFGTRFVLRGPSFQFCFCSMGLYSSSIAASTWQWMVRYGKGLISGFELGSGSALKEYSESRSKRAQH